MMDWLRKHKNAILITVVTGFVTSIFFGLGLYFTHGPGGTGAVLEVNSEKIPYKNFITLYNRVVENYREKGQETTPESLGQIKQDVIQSLVRESVFIQEAARYGLYVTDTELAQSLTFVPAFQKNGKFDPQTYAQTLHFALRTTPEEFEETQRRQMVISRLQAFVTQGVKITDKELEMEYLLSKQIVSNAIPPKLVPDFIKEKEKFREKLRQEKGAQVLNRWYQQLGTNLKVKNNLEEIEKRGGR